MPDNQASRQASRRGFLRTATGAAAAGALVLPKTVHAAGANTLRVGLVGCGGRGNAAAIDALKADPHAELVAIADTFLDRAEEGLKLIRGQQSVADRVRVEPDRVFTGFDGYKHLIDSGVDVVLLATPPHFRPEHLAYAVEKGKHCFVEKPVAVDVPGVHRVMESCRQAKEKNLAVVSGLCWRYDLGVRETMRKILEERAIGDILAIESSYNANGLWHRGENPDWSQMEYQVRNWLYFTWLSGDHILEQAVHSLDKTAWLLGDEHPVKATSLAGRQQRTDPKYGNIYDHFAVFYEYAGGERVYFTCRQQDNCSTRVDELVHGTKGRAEILRHQLLDFAGKRTWKYRGEKPSMYQVEHDEMFASIRRGAPLNNGHYMCNSTMIGLLGRMAGYTGQTVTWEQLEKSAERLGPAEYTWTNEVPVQAVAIPGKTSLA
jgi:predicted dehydrogenase